MIIRPRRFGRNQSRSGLISPPARSVSPDDAADFLEDLCKNAPAGVSSVITMKRSGVLRESHGSRNFPTGYAGYKIDSPGTRFVDLSELRASLGP